MRQVRVRVRAGDGYLEAGEVDGDPLGYVVQRDGDDWVGVGVGVGIGVGVGLGRRHRALRGRALEP